MPLFSITTNKAIGEKERTALADAASKLVSEMLGKPERYVMVLVNAGETMRFAGSDEPCAYVELKSLGLPEDKTGEYSAKLCELVDEQTGIPTDRVYIEFSGPARHLWGWNATTF